MQTINMSKAMEYAQQLVESKRMTRSEASKHIIKNYKVVGGAWGNREIVNPMSIAVKMSRDNPINKQKNPIAVRATETSNETTTTSTRKTRNMDAYHLRRDIRGVLGMNLSDSVKLLIIKEMTA